jgi:hypothetical protein
MISFTIEGVFRHGDGGGSLGNGLQEDSAPTDGVLLLTKECGQVEL